MCKWIGVICVFLGVVCILSSVGFVIYNQWEDKNADKVTQSILEDVKGVIDGKSPRPEDTEMATVKVGGYDCIGILSVPVGRPVS